MTVDHTRSMTPWGPPTTPIGVPAEVGPTLSFKPPRPAHPTLPLAAGIGALVVLTLSLLASKYVLDLARRLSARIRHMPPNSVPPEAFLICAMARYQRRNGPGTSASPAAVAPQRQGMPGAPESMNVAPGAWTPISRPF